MSVRHVRSVMFLVFLLLQLILFRCLNLNAIHFFSYEQERALSCSMKFTSKKFQANLGLPGN